MTFNSIKMKPLCSALCSALLLAGMLSACGGGGGSDGGDTLAGNVGTGGSGSTGGTGTGGTGGTGGTLVMNCPEGAGYQCSGSTVLGTDNGIAYSASSVQAYGRSTSDQAAVVTNLSNPTGFALASGGSAEFRVAKNATGNVSAPVMLLRNLGISWDGQKERPLIIEPFLPSAGRSVLGSDGRINTAVALPASSDTSFYNFVTLGPNATQLNYANNRYFPRTAPSRCDGAASCPTVETNGVQVTAGDWRTGGIMADVAEASRLHEDGDVHAGDGAPDASGPGVPFPGSKGYRSLSHWSYRYANLGTWLTQDTIELAEWRPNQPTKERSTTRRGVIAYGDVTKPANVPTTGSATYVGKIYGWYGPANSPNEPDFISGDATVTVNFATRKATVTVQNAATYTATPAPVPANFTTSTSIGTGGGANYFTGAVDSTLDGGVSGRFFGPTAAAGAAPGEIGGAIRLSSTTGGAVVAGFLGRLQQ